MENRPIRFWRRGKLVSLGNVPPTRTLLEVLREDLHCTGTKEGCGEGDCGACTVVLAELSPTDGPDAIKYRAINSCIRLAHSIDGLALWTVEDLTEDPLIQPCHTDTVTDTPTSPLHPVQQALVEHHGSQCGFCTPGFVMSLFGQYQSHIAPAPGSACGLSRTQAQEALSGNLCRCTGYRPILDAAQTMHQLPVRRVDEQQLLQNLKQTSPTPRWLAAQNPQNSPQPAAYLAPESLEALLQARQAHPGAQVVAGCTDVGLWITKQHRQFEQMLDVTRAAELRRIEPYPHHIAIGAAVPLEDAFAALQADRPQLHGFAARFAGLPVRNSGTLGGNVANGSPIGDSMPLLIALGANVVLMRWVPAQGHRSSHRPGHIAHRELPLEQLYTGYRQNVMQPDELLAWIKVPRPTPHELLRAYKISKRQDDDISAVCLVVRLEVEDGIVRSARIGAGGVAATPARARQTEAALIGQPWQPATVERAVAALRAEFNPISDMRASSAYRREVLGALLQRFWLDSQGVAPIELHRLDPATLDQPGAHTAHPATEAP